jgi:hypothetical protein
MSVFLAIQGFGSQYIAFYESIRADFCKEPISWDVPPIVLWLDITIYCYIGREIYVLVGFALTLLLYFVVPLANAVEKKEIFPNGVKPSLASYLLMFLIFSSGFWLRSIIQLPFLIVLWFYTLISATRGTKYPDRLKQHHAYMRSCLIIAVPSGIFLCGLFFAMKGIECISCLAHDLLVLILVALYFIVSSLEIKRRRDPWPFP